eukprot:CAMPEP_0114502678 /NCGR_PEP_ID=MMETSP0109-20121206/9229_1 /TAXON_ID=29199 /ORGANISM="Chlorarachnion reptans, Strain CCCM449" /LENGTH=309 /DNA_ID=CAMNT_0001680629 /DNA_START=309 /DNA_END=1238 /DNA_ORIENTATION=-
MPMEKPEFRKHIFEALMIHNDQYAYDVKDREETNSFSLEISKIARDDKFSALIATLEFKPLASNEGGKRLLQTLNMLHQKKRRELKAEKEVKENLVHLCDDYRKLIEEASSLKNEMEHELLSSFVKILNTKKSKIRELQKANQKLMEEVSRLREGYEDDEKDIKVEFMQDSGQNIGEELPPSSTNLKRSMGMILTENDDLQSAADEKTQVQGGPAGQADIQYSSISLGYPESAPTKIRKRQRTQRESPPRMPQHTTLDSQESQESQRRDIDCLPNDDDDAGGDEKVPEDTNSKVLRHPTNSDELFDQLD